MIIKMFGALISQRIKTQVIKITIILQKGANLVFAAFDLHVRFPLHLHYKIR